MLMVYAEFFIEAKHNDSLTPGFLARITKRSSN